MRTTLLTLLFLLTACGESPLLNHKLEGKSFLKDSIFSESESLKFKRTNHAFIISWQQGPQLGGSHFVMKTWDKDLGSMNGPYQDLPKALSIELFMPAMGHGSSPVKIKKLADGEYDVSDVYFIMGGTWEIRFKLKDGPQVFDETVITLSL
jgi:hypothetical protein